MMWNQADARQKLTDLIQKYDGLRHQNRLAEMTERDVIQQYIVPRGYLCSAARR